MRYIRFIGKKKKKGGRHPMGVCFFTSLQVYWFTSLSVYRLCDGSIRKAKPHPHREG